MAQSDNSFVPSALLDFRQAIDAPSALLDFGSDNASAATTNIAGQITVAVKASGHAIGYLPAVNIGGQVVYELNASAQGNLSYDPNVFRGLTHDSRGGFEVAKLAGLANRGGFEVSERVRTHTQADWQDSRLIGVLWHGLVEANKRLNQQTAIKSEAGKLIGSYAAFIAESTIYYATKAQSLRETARIIGISRATMAEAMLPLRTGRDLWLEFAHVIGIDRKSGLETAAFVAHDNRSLREFAKLPPWFYRVPLPVDNYQESAVLDFTCLWYGPQAQLNFGAVCQYQYNPIRQTDGVIFVTNSVSLTRTDDGRNIGMFGFSIGIDNNSYAWSFNAQIPYTELPKVDIFAEALINVDLTVNGQLWRFILDGCNDGWTFGERTLNIKGKSRAMLLAAPYSEHRGYKFTETLTSRQIAEAELNRNNVPSGFTLDWQLVDALGWSVPANTYSYTGRTPINSLTWIAEAAGGFINAHAWDDVIKVLPNYPIPSWEWAGATPSINISSSLIFDISRERVQKPNYNGVLVAGERDGSVMGLIRRTGTAGGYQPPMVTHDLITTEAVARAKGLSILSDVGEVGNISLSTPLHSDIGVLTPSTLVGVTDSETWVGMVRGTSITCRVGGRGDLDITQALNIERHFDKG